VIRKRRNNAQHSACQSASRILHYDRVDIDASICTYRNITICSTVLAHQGLGLQGPDPADPVLFVGRKTRREEVSEHFFKFRLEGSTDASIMLQ